MSIRSLLLFFVLFPYALSAQEWTKRFSVTGSSIDEATSILPAANNGSVVVGSSFASQSGWNVTALQYDANGNLLWINPFSYNSSSNSDDKATCAVRDQSGNIYIGGFSWSDSTGWDYLLIKLNQNGLQQWARRINSESFHNDIATAIALDAQGNIYLTGRSTSSSDVMNILTMKYDPSGNQQWSKRYNAQNTSDEEPMSIAVDGSNNIVVAGEHAGSTRDILVIKYNSSGVEQWVKTFNRTSTGDDEAHAMTIDAQSNIILVGASMPMGGMHDALIMKIKPDGSSAWTKTYNGTGNGSDHAFAVQTDAAGNVFVSAKSKGTTTGDDIATIKFKSDGTQEWVSRYAGTGTTSDNAAPRFAGVTAGRATTSTDALITWAPASDDQTEEDDIVYLLFVATSSGGQNFSSPTKVITGDNTGVIGNLLADKDYFIVVRARDEAGNTDTNTREIKIRTAKIPLSITTTDLPGGVVNTPYTAQLQAKGGKGNYSWSLTSGLLPVGLQLQASGVISGTPTTIGDSQFDVTVKDANNDTTSRSLSIKIQQEALTITTNTLPTADPGQPYSATLTTTGGTLPYRWRLVSGELPPGLHLTESGMIQDTAKDDGNYLFTVQVKDAKGDSTQKELTLHSSTPPALHVRRDTTMAGGLYWFSTVLVDNGATLQVLGAVTMNATDSVQINGTVKSSCFAIEIRTTESFSIDGLITNICDSLERNPPDVKIVADGKIKLGKNVSPTPVIITDGSALICDTFTEDRITNFSNPNQQNWLSKSPVYSPLKTDKKATVNRPAQAGRGKKIFISKDDDLIINEGMSGAPGKNAVLPDSAGGDGGSVTLISGSNLVINDGVVIQGGNGGNGLSVSASGCPAIVDVTVACAGGDGGKITFVGDTIIIGKNVQVILGNGGNGGDASAFGNPGGPCAPGCDAKAISGEGGDFGQVTFTQSSGGLPFFPEVSGGNGGNAGNAFAKGGEGGACTACPGGKGGDGGNAWAMGSIGGDGNGEGGQFPLGSGKEGDGGNADAFGGNGGHGATCCNPPQAGGMGGNAYQQAASALAYGGNAGSHGRYPGKKGTYLAVGGSGNDGGDGKPFGTKGKLGTAYVTGTPGSKQDGADGKDGKKCTISGDWYCYFSSIPDGVIQTGSVRTLDVYKSTTATPQNKVGTIDVTFGGTAGAMTKAGDSLKLKQGAKITFDFTTFTGGDPNPVGWPTWYPTKFESTFRNVTEFICWELKGYYNNQQIANQKNLNPGGAASVETISISAGANPDSKFDKTEAIATFFINIDHWGFKTTWVDP